MKTISGSILSSKSISLSKASAILNSFVSFENGAPHALSTYLRRTADSLNGLVQHHDDLKFRKSERKRKKNRLETIDNGNLIQAEKNYSLGEEHSNGFAEESVINGGGRGSERKKKSTSEFEDHLDEVEERGSEDRRERNKRKKMEEQELIDAELIRSQMKKRKY